jgi:hypothetical protein
MSASATTSFITKFPITVGAGKLAFRKLPSGTITSTHRSSPSLCGMSGSTSMRNVESAEAYVVAYAPL